MSNSVNLNKLYVAVTTPFRNDSSIDCDALIAHLTFLEKSGIEAIFLAGTTGEFETLTNSEKKELLILARKAFSGIIVFNVTSCSLHESLELSSFAKEHGADAITALPPFYRAKIDTDGIVDFFNTISKASELPLIIYNFTNHTQNEITGSMMSKIDAVAIKDSDKNLSMIPDVELYLCAGDSIMAEAISKGARGVVSVQGNYRPKEIIELFNTGFSDAIKAEEIQKEVAEVSGLFRKTKQIARIKRALTEIIPGYPSTVRLPLVNLTAEEELEIVQGVEVFLG